MRREQAAQFFLLLAVFLLPWQTRWIYSELTLQGEIWEYGRLGIYAVQILIVLAAILFGRPQYDFCLKRVTGLSIMFLGAGFLSVSLALHSGLATGAMLSLVAAVMLFMLVLDRRVDWGQVGLFLVLGLILPAGLGWWQVLTGSSPASTILGLAGHDAAVLGQSVVELANGARLLRAYGSFSHPNIFGGYLAMGLLLALWLNGQSRDKYRRWLAGGAIVIILPTLVITFSRSAWLALLIGLGTLLIVFGKKIKTLSKEAKGFGLAALILALLAAGIFHQAILTRTQPQTRLETKSIEERGSEYGQWRQVMRLQPISGVGPGNYTLALAHLNPGQPAWSYQPMHNSLLLMVAETGLFGLAILIWWLWHIFKTPDPPVWLWSGAAALVPIICFDHYLWSSWSGLAILAIFLSFFVRMGNGCRRT